MNDESFLTEAVRVAGSHSAAGRAGPFGAIIARDGQIVGMGWNRVVDSRDPTAHAEIVAIRDACRRIGTHTLRECTIYSSCEPCSMCLSAIYWARIPRVVYAATLDDAREAGFDDHEIYEQVGLSWPRRSVQSQRIPLEEAVEVLRRWQQNPDRMPY